MARTPTSATGAEAGFTLVELMVTLVILGLASTAVVMAIPDGSSVLREESERLAARLGAARDAAIVGGRDMAVRVDSAGYGFEQRRGGTWLPAGGAAFAPRRWPEGMAFIPGPNTPSRIVFDVTGLATPAVVQLQRDGQAWRVTVEAAGKVRIDAG